MKRTAFFFSLLCLSYNISCGGTIIPAKTNTRRFPHLKVVIPPYRYDIFGKLLPADKIEKMPKPAQNLRLGASPAHASRMAESHPAEIPLPTDTAEPTHAAPHNALRASQAHKRLMGSEAEAMRMLQAHYEEVHLRLLHESSRPGYIAPGPQCGPLPALKAAPAQPARSICEMISAIFCYSGLKDE